MELVAFRALQGLGGAGLTSMAQSAIADVGVSRGRSRYQGYIAVAWGFASIAGPVIGGLLTENLSWRWVFWINLPLGLLALWFSNNGLKSLKTERRPANIDYGGSFLLVCGVTALILVL